MSEHKPDSFQEMKRVLETWTLDHYRADPQLNKLISQFATTEKELELYRYLRAYLTHVICPQPQPLPKNIEDWRSPLLQLLQNRLPEVRLRLAYEEPPLQEKWQDLHMSSKNRHFYSDKLIVNKSEVALVAVEEGKEALPTLGCANVPKQDVTLQRDEEYLRLEFHAKPLLADFNSIFSRVDYFSFERILQGIKNDPTEEDAYNVSFWMMHLNPFKGCIALPKESSSPKELLDLLLANHELQHAVELLPDNFGVENPIRRNHAENVTSKVASIFQALQVDELQTVGVSKRPFSTDFDWDEIDYHVGIIWLALQEATRTPRAVQLPDQRVILQLGQELLAEIKVRPLAEGVDLPFEVCVCIDLKQLWHDKHPPFTTFMSTHTVCETIYGSSSYPTQIELPPPIQIVGKGHVIDICFDRSPLLQTIASSMYTQAASAAVVMEETRQRELEHQRQLEEEEERRRQEEEDNL